MVKEDNRQKKYEKLGPTKAKSKKFNLGNESQERRFFFSSKKENYQKFFSGSNILKKKNSKIIRIPKNNEITRKYINKLYKKKKN